MNLDDLELELRRLPGVRAAGFLEREGVLLIQLQVGPGEAAPSAAFQATRIAYRHSERPVAVEVVRWRDVPAPALAVEPAGDAERIAGSPAAPSVATGPAAGLRHTGAPTPVTETGVTETGVTETGVTETGEAETGVTGTGEADGGDAGPEAPESWIAGTEAESPGPETIGAEGETPSAAPEPGWVEIEGAGAGVVAEPPGGRERVPGGEAVSEAAGGRHADRAAGEGGERRVSAAEAVSEPRVRLLAVLTFPDTDELEVHLTFDGRRSIGRADSGLGLLGAVEATIHALRVFAPSLGYTAAWARTLESTTGEAFLVACTVSGEQAATRHGLAAGTSAPEAAARATLHSLNRTLALELAAAG